MFNPKEWEKSKNIVKRNHLKKGEVYYKRYGKNPFMVISNSGNTIRVAYHADKYTWLGYDPSYTEYFKAKKIETEKEKQTMKLFQVKETEIYGVYLVTDSKGRYVLEEKGTGKILTYDKELLEEVKPYTVNVKFLVGNDQDYSYLGVEGQVSVGDLVLLQPNNSLVVVTKVDTKSDKATKELKGKVIKTEDI